MANAHHSIQLAARLTGLSAYVIRIWEQRYGAVAPARTPTNHRLYSPADVDRLSLLRDLTQQGHSIGRIARLPNEELRRLGAELQGRVSAPSVENRPEADSLLGECLAAVRALDRRGLSEALKRGSTALGAQGVLVRLIAPLSERLGECWRTGEITAAHEHFATGLIRSYLMHLAEPFAGSRNAPTLVAATPPGQLHELGALLAAAVAVNLGWRTVYLGASLPVVEIAGAARQADARAVALSLVYPVDDKILAGNLARLRESLSAETALIVGGRGVPAYRDVLVGIGAIVVSDLAEFGFALDNLRTPTGVNIREKAAAQELSQPASPARKRPVRNPRRSSQRSA